MESYNKENQKIKKMALQKSILGEVVSYLGTHDETLYYASTMTISHEVYRIIQEGKFLNHEDNELVSDLQPHDIQILISYSSCC